MPELVPEEDREKVEAGMFRFDMGVLENMLDGKIWTLRAGVDFPALIPLKNIAARLYSAARYRDARAHVWLIPPDRLQVKFVTELKLKEDSS